MKRTIYPIILLLLCATHCWAQTCGTPDNIIQNATNTVPPATDHYAYYQTFEADCDGILDSFSVWNSSASNFDAQIYILQGAAPLSSTILTQFDYTFIGAGTPTSTKSVIEIPGTLNIVAGQKYAFAFVLDESDLITFDFDNTNPYSDGDLYRVNAASVVWSSVPGTDFRFNVNFRDQSPYVVCRENRSFALGADGTRTITFSQMSGGSGASDGETVLIRSINPSVFTCDDIGYVTVNLTIQDSSGQNASCSTSVLITDGQDPVLTCPDDLTVFRDALFPDPVTYNNPVYEDCSIAAPDGFSFIGVRDGKSYYLSQTIMVPSEAYNVAESLGGHLATIQDADHNDMIRQGANDLGITNNLLIGFNDIAVEETFVWHDSDATSTYTNWATIEPNDAGAGEDYTVMNGGGRWNDVNNGTARYFILELSEPIFNQISGIASGEIFPFGTTTNVFEATDAFGNTATCSFDITVEALNINTIVILSGGRLTINDNEVDSDDQITFSSDGTTLTISNLANPVQAIGVNHIDATTITVPISSITNGINFLGGGGNNSATFATDLTLTGTSNSIQLASIGELNQAGAIQLESNLSISATTGSDIILGEITATQLIVNNATNIYDQSPSAPITITSNTSLNASSVINMNRGNHIFSGPVILRAGQVTNFIASSDLELFLLEASTNNVSNYISAESAITITGSLLTAANSDLYLQFGTNITQTGGAVTTNQLTVHHDQGGASTVSLGRDNDINSIQTQPGTTVSLLGVVNIDDLTVGNLIVDQFTIAAPEIFLTEDTDITKNGGFPGLFTGNVTITSNSTTGPTIINHNGGTISFNGDTINLDGRLQYNGVLGTITNFLGDVQLPFGGPGVSVTFGYLNATREIYIGDTNNVILNEARITGSNGLLTGIGKLSGGPVIVEDSAAITPGGGIETYSIYTDNLEISSGIFAPFLNTDSAFDYLIVTGTVTLTDAEFVPTGTITFNSGNEELVLIDNDGADPVSGIFNGFPEGSLVPISGTTDVYFISYSAGDGNDVAIIKDTIAPELICPSDIAIDCIDPTTITLIETVNPSIDIPDDDAVGIDIPLIFSGWDPVNSPSNMTVTIAMNHTWIGDLRINLFAPTGESISLIPSSNGSDSDLNDQYPITFTDDSDISSRFIGSGIPNGSVACRDDGFCSFYSENDGPTGFADFIQTLITNGSDINGEWILNVSDNAGIDFGNVQSWSLNISYVDSELVAIDTSPAITGMATAEDITDTTITFIDVVTSDCGVAQTITRTWKATDTSGNVSTCDQIISITDTSGPALTFCPEDIVAIVAPGAAGVEVIFAEPTATDCSDITVTLTEGIASGQLFPVGDTVNTFTLTDACGNETTCSFTVTVQEGLELQVKAFLQGAGTDPIDGEPNLMRDGLRTSGVLPNISPYADGFSVDSLMFANGGNGGTGTANDDIIDWVWLELRDQSDNSIVVDGRSALIQRDGDIVDSDGQPEILFTAAAGTYYLVVQHRNHLGVMSSNTIILADGTTPSYDFTTSEAAYTGGANATVQLSSGIYCLISGDFDGNSQVQNSDLNAIIPLLGGAGYSPADLDMNAQIQNSDINILLNPNLGKGEQF
ncbi:MAG: HYR domain-containing protein [Gilvibacter sp.]